MGFRWFLWGSRGLQGVFERSSRESQRGFRVSKKLEGLDVVARHFKEVREVSVDSIFLNLTLSSKCYIYRS